MGTCVWRCARAASWLTALPWAWRKDARSVSPTRFAATPTRVRATRVGIPGQSPKVELLCDGEGNWTGPDGRVVTYLEGCGYVDIAETPFTNTLPIKRLGLGPGESADIFVAYFDGAELQPWPEPQRYACLEKDGGGGLYRFESLDGGFTADLPVDSDGLVLDYPRLFERVIP